MKVAFATIFVLALMSAPVGARTCIVSNTPKNARCHTQVYQSSVAFGRRDTSLVLACSDMEDRTARSVFEVRGRSESLRLRWVDDDTLRVEYAAGAKVKYSEPTIVLRDRVLKFEYVPVRGDTGAGCDFKEDNILNIAASYAAAGTLGSRQF